VYSDLDDANARIVGVFPSAFVDRNRFEATVAKALNVGADGEIQIVADWYDPDRGLGKLDELAAALRREVEGPDLALVRAPYGAELGCCECRKSMSRSRSRSVTSRSSLLVRASIATSLFRRAAYPVSPCAASVQPRSWCSSVRSFVTGSKR
jgi:hypothetical protein